MDNSGGSCMKTMRWKLDGGDYSAEKGKRSVLISWHVNPRHYKVTRFIEVGKNEWDYAKPEWKRRWLYTSQGIKSAKEAAAKWLLGE